MPLKIGTSAPDFTLKTKTASGLQDVKLSDNFGQRNTVLLFFPLAFTGVCTQEMCDVSGGISAYDGLNAAVYGISVDSPFAQEAWAQQEKITIKLLSDLNKTVITAYDVVFPGTGRHRRHRRARRGRHRQEGSHRPRGADAHAEGFAEF